jgi:hypothetical protein
LKILSKKDKQRVQNAEKYYKKNKIEIPESIKQLVIYGQHAFCNSIFCKYSDSNNWPDEGMHTSVLTQSELWVKWLQLCDPGVIKSAIYNYHTNRNESYHRMVWRLCPKEQNQNFQKVYGAAILAATKYNDGMKEVLDSLEKINLPVEHLREISKSLDEEKFSFGKHISRPNKPTDDNSEREYVAGGDEIDW